MAAKRKRDSANDGSKEVEIRRLIPELCNQFYHLGWMSGTGGAMSIREGPNRILVTPSAVQKERLKPAISPRQAARPLSLGESARESVPGPTHTGPNQPGRSPAHSPAPSTPQSRTPGRIRRTHQPGTGAARHTQPAHQPTEHSRAEVHRAESARPSQPGPEVTRSARRSHTGPSFARPSQPGPSATAHSPSPSSPARVQPAITRPISPARISPAITHRPTQPAKSARHSAGPSHPAHSTRTYRRKSPLVSSLRARAESPGPIRPGTQSTGHPDPARAVKPGTPLSLADQPRPPLISAGISPPTLLPGLRPTARPKYPGTDQPSPSPPGHESPAEPSPGHHSPAGRTRPSARPISRATQPGPRYRAHSGGSQPADAQPAHSGPGRAYRPNQHRRVARHESARAEVSRADSSRPTQPGESCRPSQARAEVSPGHSARAEVSPALKITVFMSTAASSPPGHIRKAVTCQAENLDRPARIETANRPYGINIQ
eukprot:gene5848-11167_t